MSDLHDQCGEAAYRAIWTVKFALGIERACEAGKSLHFCSTFRQRLTAIVIAHIMPANSAGVV